MHSVQDQLTLLLRAEGCRVSVCYDGPAALPMARACRPDVALLGPELPGLSADEVARQLRQDACGRPLLVALAGHAGEGRPGFDALLVKPVGLAELRPLLAVGPESAPADAA